MRSRTYTEKSHFNIESPETTVYRACIDRSVGRPTVSPVSWFLHQQHCRLEIVVRTFFDSLYIAAF